MKPLSNTRNFQQDSENTLWYTADVSKFLRCSERQVFALRQQGLPALHIGGMVRFDPARVRAWLSEKDERIPSCERHRQLADLTNENDDDAAECAAADLHHEFHAETVR